MNCNHANFDEYFEKCTDCGADKAQVLKDGFKAQLQELYGDVQKALGVNGDITPERMIQLEDAENKLAEVFTAWMLEAQGADE